MNDPNRMMKWVLICALVALSIAVLYPPHRKLKGGIDLVGGTSLLFEIDTTGLDRDSLGDLSTKVMRILKDRVDPKGQLNLEWRPVGTTRLEVRMPRPPKEALERRAEYNAAIDRLQEMNIRRREAEEALGSSSENRESLITALQRGHSGRAELLTTLTSAYDELQKARAAGDGGATETAAKTYEDAMSALLATNIPINRLTDVLALGSGETRKEQIEKLRSEFSAFDAGDSGSPNGKLLSKAISAYDAWASNKAELEDPSDLKRRLKGAGVLEFRILAERSASSPTQLNDPNPRLIQPIARYTDQLAKFGPRSKQEDAYRWFPIEDPLRFSGASDMEEFKSRLNIPGGPVIEEYAGRYYVLMHNSPENKMVKGTGGGRPWELKSAFPDRNPMTGENVVSFALNPVGGQLFGELTGKNEKRQLCILLDQHAISHATIQERITDRCQISGRFSPERVNEMVNVLDAGSLPARLKETPLSEETIGPSLGETNRRHGLQASAIGAGLVALFVLFYYGIVGGGIANMALALNVLFVLAAMALMQATFTLPGIAGVILTVGMAIDANVLIFERIREERLKGFPLRKALNAGYDKAFSAIFDSNLTTLITCVILGSVASEEVKGFAITLGIGIATSMFTALFCTRLAFNTLIAKGVIEDLHMRRLIGIPKVDWVGLRRTFLPVSCVATVLGLGLFVYTSVSRTERVFDIEFLGGTSIQLDLKPGVALSDQDVRDLVTETSAKKGMSAVQWLTGAGEKLAQAESSLGDAPGQFVLESKELSGDELAALMRATIEPSLERDGVHTAAQSATFTVKSGSMTKESFSDAVKKASTSAREAANRLRGARVQSVGEEGLDGAAKGQSYEVVTVETNRPLIQQAILSTIGDKLAVQRAIRFTAVVDSELTNEPFFVVESDDHFLSDVLNTDAQYDIRRFRGGVVVEAAFDEAEPPVTPEQVEARLREVALSPEFEQYRTRDTAVFPLGSAESLPGGSKAYQRFAICAVDESMLYEDDNVQWTEVFATSVLAQTQAALGIEKSFSKVVQFAPQIAGQTRNRALFSMVLAMAAIAAYVWMRFGNRDFGLAVLVALFHDVAITLGLVGLSHYIFDNPLAKLLLIEDFKVDLPMVAAVLTVVGYSLNDTIVVFDRIRENKGRTGALSASMINESINQTMSRTLLTSLTVFFVVFVLYVIGGKGVHGFSVALLIGVLSGTYSTVGIAVPLVYKPRILYNISIAIVAMCLIGFVFLVVKNATAELILAAAIAVGAAAGMVRTGRSEVDGFVGQPART